MTGARLLAHQVRYELIAFRRNPAAVFFTAMLPVIFLVVFVGIFGNEYSSDLGIRLSTYYVPSILALSVVSATFVSFAMAITRLREDGVLKRLRGTPLPPAVYIAGRIASSFVICFLIVGLLCVIGGLGYSVDLPTRTLAAFLVTVLVGAASLCCLGLAVTAIIPSEEAAPAVTNAIVLPLYFISGVFFSTNDAPAWVRTVASLFPIRHLGEALLQAFDPRTTGSGFAWADLGVIALWGVAGLLVSLRYFRWTPRT